MQHQRLLSEWPKYSYQHKNMINDQIANILSYYWAGLFWLLSVNEFVIISLMTLCHWWQVLRNGVHDLIPFYKCPSGVRGNTPNPHALYTLCEQAPYTMRII